MSNLPELNNFIGGEFSPPSVSLDGHICDANSGQTIQSKHGSNADQVEAALAAAWSCYKDTDWERDIPARITALHKIADELSQDKVQSGIARADALTTGVVIGSAGIFAKMLPVLFRHAAQILEDGRLSVTKPGKRGEVTSFRRPWGPALLISPWNGPTPIGGHKLASAIAAGAPALVKPSVWTPHSALAMVKAASKADMPDGAVNLLMGDRLSVKPMLGDERVKAVSFTGGLGGGRAVARACAEKFIPTQLELGGNNALIVLEGADINAAANGIVFGLANLNGQWCRALGRILVHKPLKSRLMDRVLELLSEIRLGSSLDDNSQMGPQAHARQFSDIQKSIDHLVGNGGTAFAPTKRPELPGYFVPPTIIDGCAPEDTRDEMFGPAAAIHSFDTESEALKLANDPPYGLAGYVYGPDDGAMKFAAEMRTGGVKVNGYSMLSLRGDFPRGAWSLSGLGEEGGWESIRFLTGSRSVGLSPQDELAGGA